MKWTNPYLVKAKNYDSKRFTTDFGTEIESAADYRSRRIVHPADVWQNVAAIENLNSGNMAHVLYARELLRHEKRRDFQRNFLTDR